MTQSPLCKSITQAVLASLTAEAPVVTQSNLPKPRQTWKRAGAMPAAVSMPEWALTATAPPHLDNRRCYPHTIYREDGYGGDGPSL